MRLFEREAAKTLERNFPRVFYLSYRAPPEEADSEKPFDYSPRALRRRRKAGMADMAQALAIMSEASEGGIITIRRGSADQDSNRGGKKS